MIDVSHLVGIPFKDGGRDLTGCDCQGLVLLGFALFGQTVPDYRVSCFDYAGIHGRVERSRSLWQPLPEPETPCLVTMHGNPEAPEMVTHLGVYVGDGRMLHTTAALRKSVLARVYDSEHHIEGFYRYVG